MAAATAMAEQLRFQELMAYVDEGEQFFQEGGDDDPYPSYDGDEAVGSRYEGFAGLVDAEPTPARCDAVPRHGQRSWEMHELSAMSAVSPTRPQHSAPSQYGSRYDSLTHRTASTPTTMVLSPLPTVHATKPPLMSPFASSPGTHHHHHHHNNNRPHGDDGEAAMTTMEMSPSPAPEASPGYSPSPSAPVPRRAMTMAAQSVPSFAYDGGVGPTTLRPSPEFTEFLELRERTLERDRAESMPPELSFAAGGAASPARGGANCSGSVGRGAFSCAWQVPDPYRGAALADTPVGFFMTPAAPPQHHDAQQRHRLADRRPVEHITLPTTAVSSGKATELVTPTSASLPSSPIKAVCDTSQDEDMMGTVHTLLTSPEATVPEERSPVAAPTPRMMQFSPPKAPTGFPQPLQTSGYADLISHWRPAPSPSPARPTRSQSSLGASYQYGSPRGTKTDASPSRLDLGHGSPRSRRAHPTAGSPRRPPFTLSTTTTKTLYI